MQWENLSVRRIDSEEAEEAALVREFLRIFGLDFSGRVEYTAGAFLDERLIATGSFDGEVLRHIAVEEKYRGQDVTATIVTHLLNQLAQRGRYHSFLFTKSGNVPLFLPLGFKEIARAEPYAALLEAGVGSVESYCLQLKEELKELPAGARAALVINANPFTLGHLAVIEKASRENAAVVVMVVSEDRSVVPFSARFDLVYRGTCHLPNVAVIPAGKYSVSAATFPDYFTKGEAAVLAQTRLDATIFARYLAPAMGVTARYVGEEPYCAVTRAYNQALEQLLPEAGVSVVVMPRLEADGEIISASLVRQCIVEGKWEIIRQLVPTVTYEYLTSSEAQPVVEAIKRKSISVV